MGLDMYLYKLTKVSEEEAAKVNAEDLKCTYFMKNERTDRLLQHVMPWLTKTDLSIQVWDMDKIKKSVGAPIDANVVVESHGGDYVVEFMFRKGEETYTATIMEDEVDEFSMRIDKPAYLVNMEKVGYWRKDYALAEKISDAFLSAKKPEKRIYVENTGYYPLTGAVRQVIRRSGKPTFNPNDRFGGYGYNELKTESKDSVICYHEWY